MAGKLQTSTSNSDTSRSPGLQPRCGLCGKAERLTKTGCCSKWICDDEDQYVIFSYARNSCHRNHDHYTLCAHHHNEGHDGTWQDCQRCRESFKVEIYVYFGTNEYNFEKLSDPPAYEPTKCGGCGKIIHLGSDGYSVRAGKHFCQSCTDEDLARLTRSRKAQ
jgi:hypothetical protein